jgi:Leucine-rich repeat (LRR) protein
MNKSFYRQLILVSLFIFTSSPSLGQIDKHYTSLKEALKTPELVYDLDLSNQGLNELPTSIGLFTDLTTLNLYANNLKALPKSLKKLTNVNWLSLSNNDFKEFPNSIVHLTEL